MRILHTSDWHLGHHLYGHDRTEEHMAMIDQMVAIVAEERPDVFLLCGDVYDTAQPSAAVQKMFVNALVRIQQANPDMTIIVTAGNHDSGSRHEVFRIPWKALGVEVIGALSPDTPDSHIVAIPGKGFVVALPYANERYIPEGFIQGLIDTVGSRNSGNLPVVMTAHTTVKGADYSGHDRINEYTVGGIEGIEIELLGTGYDYLALGHIHHDQFVHTGRHNVRYSGSPIPVSFDERFDHSVSIVDIEGHGAVPRVRKILIENPVPLLTVPSEGATDWDTAIELLFKFPDRQKAYIRLNVEVESSLPPGAVEEAFYVTKHKQCRFCGINQIRSRSAAHSEKSFSVKEFKELDPMELAMQFAGEEGIKFDDDMQEMFREIMSSIQEEERER